MICTICESPLDDDEAFCGEIGIIPVCFCPTCLNGVKEMAQIVFDYAPVGWVPDDG